jgi:hypothetical protein
MEYRAFFLGGNGHVFASEVIVAENDEEAMLRATRLRDDHDIEVWQLDRKVALIKAPRKGGPRTIRRDRPR